MSKSKLHQTLHLFLSCGIAFMLSFKFLVPPLILLLCLNWLVEANFKEKLSSILNNKFALLFLTIYVYYFIAMLYSSNTTYGWADLQTKFSLFIFPILFASSRITNAGLRSIALSFISGICCASIFLLARAIYFYFSEQINYFYYTDFSYLVHPSYFGMFINLALILLLSNLGIIRQFSIRFSVIFFFTVIILLLSSKLALLSTFLIYFVFAIYKMIVNKRYMMGTFILFLFLLSTILLIRFVPELNARIQNAVTAIRATKIDKTDSESNAVRLLVWDAAKAALIENGMFGTGTGDVKDELFKQYAHKGYTGALEHKLNAHNQFLQTGVALGFLGMVLLIAQFLVPLYVAGKQKNYVFVAFVLLVSINFLTESMLEAEAGVIFIGFFQSLLFFRPTQEMFNFANKNV